MRSLFKRWSRQTGQTGLYRPTRDEALAQYNTYDARSALSQLLRRVREGERIVIARAGEPVAMLVPFQDTAETRPGMFRLSLLLHDAPENSQAPPERGGGGVGPPAPEVTPTRSSREASTSHRAQPG
jgi:prevent-host-death family protein